MNAHTSARLSRLKLLEVLELPAQARRVRHVAHRRLPAELGIGLDVRDEALHVFGLVVEDLADFLRTRPVEAREPVALHVAGAAERVLAVLAEAEETTAADLDACLRSLAERQFGRLNADTVLAAWKDWSDAIEWHAARDFDQYGVLRVGPTYPFAFYGEKIPDPPQCLGDEPGHTGGKWIYVWGTAGMKWGRIEPHEIAPYLEMNRKELALWQRGNARLAQIKDIPSECRETARRLIGLGKYCEHTLRSSCNVKRYWLAGLNKAGKDEIAKILKDETENVKGLIPYVEADSQLGWEPSMRYVTDAPCLRWKLQHLQQLQTR